MTGEDLRTAREKLGVLWGLDRPTHAAELGRALRLSKDDPGRSIRRYEAARKADVPGPMAVAVEMMLRGALPPGGIRAALTARKTRTQRESKARA